MSGRGDDAFWRNEDAVGYSEQERKNEALRREVEEIKNRIFGGGAEPEKQTTSSDPVNHPKHYATNGPTCPHCGSNIECITITERMGFCLGNTVKYIWRKDAKGKALEDLKKARWYLDREISKLEAE